MANPNAMIELCTLMVYRQLTAERFEEWALRHYGDPGERGSLVLARWVARHHTESHPLDGMRVLEFDSFLRRPEVEDCEFTRALIELRNVFARSANMATPVTVSLGPTPDEPTAPLPPTATEVLSEVLARLLCAERRGVAPAPPERSRSCGTLGERSCSEAKDAPRRSDQRSGGEGQPSEFSESRDAA